MFECGRMSLTGRVTGPLGKTFEVPSCFLALRRLLARARSFASISVVWPSMIQHVAVITAQLVSVITVLPAWCASRQYVLGIYWHADGVVGLG